MDQWKEKNESQQKWLHLGDLSLISQQTMLKCEL